MVRHALNRARGLARRGRRVRLLARRALLALLALLGLGLALYAWGEWERRRDPRPRLLALRGPLIAADERLERVDVAHEVRSIRLESDAGVAVSALLRAPRGAGPYPALIVLGGLRTGRRTLDYLGDTEGLVLLCLDYPYAGKREGPSAREFLGALPSMRRAVIETVPAAMLGVDYLRTCPQVDPARIAIAGGSFGALFVPAVAALDPRIAAAAILFGAGDLERLARASIRAPAPLAAPAAWAVAVLCAPVEPLRFVGDIAPRPLLLLAATDDARVPRACTEALAAAAGEPKTLRWIETGHLNVRDPAFRELVGQALLEWLAAVGILDETPADRAQAAPPTAEMVIP